MISKKAFKRYIDRAVKRQVRKMLRDADIRSTIKSANYLIASMNQIISDQGSALDNNEFGKVQHYIDVLYGARSWLVTEGLRDLTFGDTEGAAKALKESFRRVNYVLKVINHHLLPSRFFKLGTQALSLLKDGIKQLMKDNLNK